MRFYLVNGNYYPSVTTVLSVINKPGLNHWRGMVGNHTADTTIEEAGDHGTLVHKACEAIAKGEPWLDLIGEDYGAALAAQAFEDWFNANVEEVIAVELAVVDSKFGYAGRVDLVARLKGDTHPAVIDVKTGKLDSCINLQLAAYKAALTDADGNPTTDRRIIVHLDKKEPGKITVKDCEGDGDFRVFLAARSLWSYFGHSTPKPGDDVVEL